MKILFELFGVFFRVGCFTFGGGYAMLPLLRKEMVVTKQWAQEEELLDYYALGQSVPGIIAINTATFIGYKKAGVPGAVFATAGMVMPSLIIIISIASLFLRFNENPYVRSAFNGITPAVAALIAGAVIKMAKKAIKGWFGITVSIISFFISVIFGLSPVWIIITAAAAGIIKGRIRGEHI